MARRIAVLAWMGLLLPSLLVAASPKLEVDVAVYEFGVVFEGEEIRYDFLLKNTGDEALVIDRVSSSCGCTTTSLEGATLEPGESTRMAAHLGTSGFGGLTIDKRIYIDSNDPESPRTTLLLLGTVVERKPFLVDPADVAALFVLLIDTRELDAYLEGHLLGAVSLPATDVDTWRELLPRTVPIVLYDQGGESAEAIAESMLPLGYTDLRVMLGGLDEWIARYGDRRLTTIPFVIVL